MKGLIKIESNEKRIAKEKSDLVIQILMALGKLEVNVFKLGVLNSFFLQR
jgi:hypothetical protein